MNPLIFEAYFCEFLSEWLPGFFMDEPYISRVRRFAAVTGESFREDLQDSQLNCTNQDLSESERKMKGEIL
jgi:hypothetical protein